MRNYLLFAGFWVIASLIACVFTLPFELTELQRVSASMLIGLFGTFELNTMGALSQIDDYINADDELLKDLEDGEDEA